MGYARIIELIRPGGSEEIHVAGPFPTKLDATRFANAIESQGLATDRGPAAFAHPDRLIAYIRDEYQAGRLLEQPDVMIMESDDVYAAAG